MTTLPPFPLSGEVLDQVEHALEGCLSFDAGRDPVLVGADFSLPQLLEFLSGVDRSRAELLEAGVPGIDGPEGAEVWLLEDPCYSEHDLIRALVGEVRRLRRLASPETRTTP